MKRFFCILCFGLLCVAVILPLHDTEQLTVGADDVEDRYCLTITPHGGVNINTVTDTIYYSYKQTDEYFNPYKLPEYYYNVENTCANTSGGVLIGHYDRLYDELIPNHTGRALLGKYFYATQGAAIDNMFDSLYALMGSTVNGTTAAGYKAGLTSYVMGKNRHIAYTNVRSGTAPNYSACISALQSGKLLSLFFNDFEIVPTGEIKTFNGYDTVARTIYAGRHSMIAYGYKFESYYDANGNLIRKDNYFYVGSGLRSNALALLRVNGISEIDDMFITEVY
jgi:hypothetical protein